MEAKPPRPSPSTLAPCAETLAAVGSIDQPAERLDPGLNSKLLTYKGEINGHLLRVLVDGGSMGDFISSRLVEQLALETQTIAAFSILFPNGETSPCNKEIINACLRIQEHQEEIHPKVVPLPHHDLILGKPWLEKWNPPINWRTNQICITRDGHRFAINQVTSKDPNPPPLPAKKLRPEVTIPQRMTMGAAGYDLYAAEEKLLDGQDQVLVPTGVALQIPDGCFGLIKPRSGWALKNRISVDAGVIDSDFRGDIQVLLVNRGAQPFTIQKGDRIAQLVLVQIITPPIQEVETLSSSIREDKGFGSTDSVLLPAESEEEYHVEICEISNIPKTIDPQA